MCTTYFDVYRRCYGIVEFSGGLFFCRHSLLSRFAGGDLCRVAAPPFKFFYSLHRPAPGAESSYTICIFTKRLWFTLGSRPSLLLGPPLSLSRHHLHRLCHCILIPRTVLDQLDRARNNGEVKVSSEMIGFSTPALSEECIKKPQKMNRQIS